MPSEQEKENSKRGRFERLLGILGSSAFDEPASESRIGENADFTPQVGTGNSPLVIFTETDDARSIENWMGGDGYKAFAEELHVDTPKGPYTFRAEDDTLIIEYHGDDSDE